MRKRWLLSMIAVGRTDKMTSRHPDSDDDQLGSASGAVAIRFRQDPVVQMGEDSIRDRAAGRRFPRSGAFERVTLASARSRRHRSRRSSKRHFS